MKRILSCASLFFVALFMFAGNAFAVAPTITSIAPATSTIAGGISVVITGTGFATSTVTIGGNLATTTASSPTSLTVTVPATSTPGLANVVVTNEDLGTISTSTAFTYVLVGSVQATVNLGTAANFAILAKSGITGGAGSTINGDIGVSPITSTAMTGFAQSMDSSGTFANSSVVTGRLYAADYTSPTPSMLTTAIGDMTTAYNTDYVRATPDYTDLGAGNIGGMTLVPGLYKWTTGVIIPSDVTLSGSSTAVWIFQIAGDLDISSAMHIILAGDAQAKNIFWLVAGTVALNTTSVFNGNIICVSTSGLHLYTGATLNGRALSTFDVTLQSNIVNIPALSSAKSILSFTIPGQVGSTTISEAGNTIDINVPSGTTVTSLVPTIAITGASVAPLSGAAQSFASPVTYTVTGADSTTHAYTVTVHIQATAPVSATLAVGSASPVGGVTNVVIPVAGATDSTGAVTGWVSGTSSKIKFTLTDGGSATSTIKINGSAYTSGADYTITSTASLTIIATTTEAGKATGVRTFIVTVGTPTQATPTFSPAAGAISFGSTVTITSAGADAIYYTTNGTNPTTGSTNQATTPLVINASTTVKSLAVKSGYANSAIATAAYTQASSHHNTSSTGGGSVVVTPVATTTTATSTATTTVIVTVVPSSTSTVISTTSVGGYNFTGDLQVGSKGTDVTELQKVLVAGGYLKMPAGVAYGFFGNLTKDSLIKYQKAKGITPAVGYFGPKTKAVFNSMNTPSANVIDKDMTLKQLVQMLLQMGAIGSDKIDAANKLINSL